MRRFGLALGCFAILASGVAAQEPPSSGAQAPPRRHRECITIHGDGPDRIVCTVRGGPRSGAAFGQPHSYRRQGVAPGAVLPTGAEPPGALTAVRALILPAEMPPTGVAAYGIVAFPTLPLAEDRARFGFVCEAYRSTLIASEAAKDVPRDQQMITFWPVTVRSAAEPTCNAMIDGYDLKAGLDAIRDADADRQHFASRRGPFLIAWSPSLSRSRPDAVILVIDMSKLESAESFQETFQAWRQKIVDDPKFWRNGFSLEDVRLALRDALDHYGARLVPFMPGGEK